MELTSQPMDASREAGSASLPAKAAVRLVAVPRNGLPTSERGFAEAVDLAEATPETVWVSFLAVLPRMTPGRLLYMAGLKRVFDVTGAGLGLLVLGLPMLLAALIIRLDSPGPALFRQTRIGQGGKPFKIFKFRTMVHDGHEDELQLLLDDDGQLRHKVKCDPRHTRVGKVLRRTSFDEVPQLLNVLRGEMSLIGPRPELPQIVANYESWQHQRHLTRPGLTGWWQVSGRGSQPMHEHTELDLYYIEHVSFRFDVKILWKTIRVVLSGLGAF